MKKLDSKGFTLLEIILVITIMGILITMIVPNFGRSQLSAKVATHNSNVNMLKSAAAMYIVDYPIKEKLPPNGELDIKKIKLYLDEDSDLKVDPILCNEANLSDNEFKVYITPKGSIKIKPGELIFNNNDQLVEKTKDAS